MGDDAKTVETLQAEFEEMKGKLAEAIDTRDSAKEKLRKMESQLAETKDLQTKLAKFEREQAKAENERLKQAGDFESLEKQLKAEHEQKHKALFDRYSRVVLDNALFQAAVESNSADPQTHAGFMRAGFRVDPETLDVVLNEDSLKSMGLDPLDKSQPKTPKALMQDFVGSVPTRQKAAMPGGGAGTGNGGKSQMGASTDLDAFFKMPPDQQSEVLNKADDATKAAIKEEYFKRM